MSWLAIHAAAHALAAGLSLWAAMVVRSRRSIPGSPAFGWLMLAVAHWCLTSALHALVPDLTARVAISQVQYLAVGSVATLWLWFAAGYARAAWTTGTLARIGLWIVPVTTAALAFTNARHGWLWSAVRPTDTFAGVAYVAGPWFWVNVVYSYALVLAGIALLAVGLRRFPPPFQPRRVLVAAGALAPVLANLLFLIVLRPAGGPDPTPFALTLSGVCFTWGLYHYRLFGLVPVARDMVVDSLDDGVLVLDAERRLIDLNASAERHTGVAAALVGRRIDEIVPWWSAAGAERGDGPGMPIVVRVEPGERVLEVRVSAVRDRARHFTGWLVLVRDITARRRAEAERLALERRVQEKQKADSLTVFAAGVAHDFNNLLTGILGNADLLAMQAPPDSTQRRTAETIVAGAQRAADLVSDMLAYAGEGRVVAERVDLDVLVREMVGTLAASVSRHCTLSYHGAGPLPLVEVDPTQIRQVITNLIVNATEAVAEGGLVTVATGQETLDREALSHMTYGGEVEPGRYVFVDVVDNGHGMTDETQARMFDPFFSTRDLGRGLGLAAVRGIVRSHHAALRVTSAPGQGTRVRVWLSLMPGRPAAAGR